MFLHIGYGNQVSKDKIIAVVSPSSSPVKRRINEAEDKGLLIDATKGKKTQSVIFTETHVILSALSMKAIADRARSEQIYTHQSKEMCRSE